MPGEGFEPPTFGLQNRCTATVLTRRTGLDVTRDATTPPAPPRPQGATARASASVRRCVRRIRPTSARYGAASDGVAEW